MSIKVAMELVIKRFDEIQEELVTEEIDNKSRITLSKELSNLNSSVALAKQFAEVEKNLSDLLSIENDTECDEELLEIAKKEIKEQEIILEELGKNFRLALCPVDEDDHKNAILEIRAGTGGMEAALFASNLYRMYQKLAERKGWKIEVMSLSVNEIGGHKEIICNVKGTGVFALLKFESGVHRVQRVPETESSGRLHTSAATVAVLPEIEEVDLKIDEKELRIDIYRSSGPGGQSVNTTDSAIRITHLPSGITVTQQDEKSQHKNKAKAMKILRAKLYEVEKRKKQSERTNLRKEQIGSGDRSERIRTYNFPQSRVTDHRVNITLYKLDSILKEGMLDEITSALTTKEKEDKLKSESEF